MVLKLRHLLCMCAAIANAWLLGGCMRWDYADGAEAFDNPAGGLFISNEGNFQYGNASLSFYDPLTREAENGIFQRANAMKLGDVAQSMVLADGRLWIAVNNSHVIFAIDPDTYRERGRIEGLTSPRYIHFVDSRKAYVSQLWDNRIFIIDPSSYSITGSITVPGMAMGSASTEQMVQVGRYVYCTCWSYQDRIIKIDTSTDEVVGSLTVGLQPRSLVADSHGRLWTITDGGYDGSPAGHEPPALVSIDAEPFAIGRILRFAPGDLAGNLVIDGDGERLYWINGGVWTMDVSSVRLPSSPVIDDRSTRYYGLTLDPASGDIYVADAIDSQQQGIVYRYSPSGELIDQFYAGISPGAFCWKPGR